MKKVYVYEDFSGFDIILRDSEIPTEKLYDPICDESCELLLITEDFNEIEPIFSKYGFTPNTARYHELTRAFKEILYGKINSSEIE